MEGFLVSLIVLLVASVAVAGPAGFIIAAISRKRLREIEKELREIRLRLLDTELERARVVGESEIARSAGPPARPAPPAPAEAIPPPVVPPMPERTVQGEPSRPANAPPIMPPWHRPQATSPAPAAAPSRASRAPSVSAAPRRPAERLETFEALVGGAWLNRLGVALLVIGLVFGLGYSFARLGPAGKAALATLVSVSMIAGGLAFERRSRWRDYGRALIAGGWAALYATAYAVHGIDATRIVESPLAGFVLLLLVAGGMIAHSLRYSSQALTSLAYGLAYAAIAVHSLDVYTLAAGTLLGAGVVLHLIRRRWQTLAWEGMAATYGSIFLWYLRQGAADPSALKLGLAALLIDWLVFLGADFLPDPSERTARLNAQSISILNAGAAGMLGLFIWMRLSPATAWAPLAAVGVAYALMSAVSRRAGHSSVHPIHSAAAVLLLGAAAWQRFDLEGTIWCWLAIAQATFLIGAALKDRFHRVLGCVAFLAPSAAIAYAQFGARAVVADGIFDLHRLLLAAAACGCFYLTYMKLGAGDGAIERDLRLWFSWASFTLIVLSLWVQLPVIWLAPALALLLLVLFEVSAVLGSTDLRAQAHAAGALSILSVFGLSATSSARLGSWDARWLTMGVVAAAGFLIFLRLRSAAARLLTGDSSARALFSWGGALVTGSTIWLLVRPAAVGPLWVLLAVALVESGIALREADLRRPGYAALLAGQISLALSNLATTERVGSFSLRLATVLPSVIASYYLWWRLRDLPRTGSGDENDEVFGRVVTWLTAALGGMFVRFEFGLANASLRWSLGMLVLMGVGHLLGDADLRLQGWLLAVGLAGRAVAFDFQQSTPVFGVDGPLACAVVTVASCVAVAIFMKWRSGANARPERRSARLDAWLQPRGFDILSILAVSLAAVYSYRVHSGFLLIVAWALEGLAAAACGFGLQARSLRLAGLGLLGAGLAMTMYRTATTFDTMGRIVSFTVLGIVLLLVSYGYTKYREALRRSP